MGVDGGRNETEVAEKWSSKQWRRKTKANFGFKRKILGKVLSIAAFQLLTLNTFTFRNFLLPYVKEFSLYMR